MRKLRYTTSRQTSHAFTLAEVLVALGLFALGFAAVAAIFPVGVHLQRQTIAASQAKQLAKNAKAVIQASDLTNSQLSTYLENEYPSNEYHGRVKPLDSDTSSSGPSDYDGILISENNDDTIAWPLVNRGHPSTTPPETGIGQVDYLPGREYYWLALARNTAADDAENMNQVTEDGPWELFVFVLRREDNAVYPRLGRGASDDSDTTDWDKIWAIHDPQSFDTPETAPRPGVKSLVVDNINNTGDQGEFDLEFPDHQDARSEFSPGGKLLDSNGNDYTVVSATDDTVTVGSEIDTTPEEPAHVWYSPPPRDGRTSPLKRIESVRLTD